MPYQLSELGHVDQGKVVEISLNYAASIKVMDTTNYYSFKKGGKYKYIGEYVDKSPYQITIPYPARWYVVLELDGLAAKVASSVKILPSSALK